MGGSFRNVKIIITEEKNIETQIKMLIDTKQKYETEILKIDKDLYSLMNRVIKNSLLD